MCRVCLLYSVEIAYHKDRNRDRERVREKERERDREREYRTQHREVLTLSYAQHYKVANHCHCRGQSAKASKTPAKEESAEDLDNSFDKVLKQLKKDVGDKAESDGSAEDDGSDPLDAAIDSEMSEFERGTSPSLFFTPLLACDRPRFDSHFCGWDFSEWSHVSNLNLGARVATLPGTWCYRVSDGTGGFGVSIL